MTRSCNCTGSLASKFELSRKGNQLTKASCKTCGGRPLVNGIGPASMLSKVGVELTNFIDPDLSWKTLTRGRRSRKPAGRSFNVGAKLGNKSPKRVWGSSVSESEKLGVAIPGQLLSDKIEHVPIKKRRCLLRSPSPPPRTPSQHHEESLSRKAQTLSPHSEDSEQRLDGKCASGEWYCPDSFSIQQVRDFDGSIVVEFADDNGGVMDDNVFEVTDRKLCCTEDFSGIALLAAAACISSIGGEAGNGKKDLVADSTSQVFGSPNSTMPLEETITSTGTGNKCQNDLVHEDNVDGSFVQDNSVVSQKYLGNKDDGGAARCVPSKELRLHWDLNTVMDVWDQPCDYSTVDFQRNVSGVNDGMQRETLEKFKLQRDSEVNNQGAVQSTMCRMITADVDEQYVILDPKGTVTRPSKSLVEEQLLEACSDLDRTCVKDKCICTPHGHPLEPLNYNGDDTKASGQGASMYYDTLYPVSHSTPNICLSEKKMDTSSACTSVMQNNEDCCRTTSQLGKITSSERVQLRKHDVAFADVLVREKAVSQNIIQNKDHEDIGKTSELPDTGTSPREVIGTITCTTVDVEVSQYNSDKVDHSHASPECEDLSASGTSVGGREGQLILYGDAKGPDDRTTAADVDFPVRSGHMESMSQCYDNPVSDGGSHGGFILQNSFKSYTNDPTSCSCEIALPFDDRHNGDVLQKNHGHMVSATNRTELQADYDSPFEDGELRESVVYSFEEEMECVDYESDDREVDNIDESHHHMPEKVEVGCAGSQPVEKGASLLTKVITADFCKSKSVKTSSNIIDDTQEKGRVGTEGLNEGSRIAVEQSGNMRVELYDDSARSHSCDHMDGLDVNGLDGKEVGSSASSGKLSCIEGPSTFDVLDRKDTMLIRPGRSHNRGGLLSGVEKNSDSVKSMGSNRPSLHVRERNEGNGYWDDSSVGHWDSRGRHPPVYHASYTRPSVNADSAGSFDRPNCRDHKQFPNSSSRGMYRPPIRRRSSVDEEDYYDFHRGMPPVRGIGGDRNRGRSGKYLPEVSRAPMDGYRDHVPGDGSTSSVRVPHYSTRKDRSFSPTFGRWDHISRPHRRSRSRSRARSPPVWHLQRERNLGTRRYSRSPDFRPEARMERVRFAFQKPRFVTDHEGSVMSPPRGHFSPRRNSRGVNDGDCVEEHSRDRRPTVRTFRQSQRFHSINYSGRLKPDGYVRPMISSGRFPPVAGATGACKFEDSDNGRRHDERCGIIDQVKQYDTGGVRQYRYDSDDCFEACDSHYKGDCSGTDRREVSRRFREERSSFRYNHNRM
ncbi:unnamed protein product [Ilex paraguariensis]|uniref:Uncharacterized protein n=1 Tax=Ilex paraguariensis TaxID=185542 RepID=A0ABC8U762_9AQUA